jgi:8-oxo-dGTP pyrophosphatase MutT (NUDIX family)
MIAPEPEPPRDRHVAALCYRTAPRLEILLVTSRETRRWVTPKGWPMAGRPDLAAAAIEAFEEAGLAQLILDFGQRPG